MSVKNVIYYMSSILSSIQTTKLELKTRLLKILSKSQLISLNLPGFDFKLNCSDE